MGYWLFFFYINPEILTDPEYQIDPFLVSVCVSVRIYLIGNASVVVVPHPDSDWTLDFIRRGSRGLVTLSIWSHLYVFMDYTCDTHTYLFLIFFFFLWYCTEVEIKTDPSNSHSRFHFFLTTFCFTSLSPKFRGCSLTVRSGVDQ